MDRSLEASSRAGARRAPEAGRAAKQQGELYSPSRLASFERCPKKFELRYVLKIPAQTESIEAYVGKRVHEILEKLHKVVDELGRVPSLARVLHRFRALFDERFEPERVRIVRPGMTRQSYVENGERCLRNYYQRNYPFDRDETLGLEERLVFELDAAGAYRVQGIVDRIVRAPDGALEIHDYKTGARVPSQAELDRDRQLALYQVGLAQRYGEGRPIRLIWHYLLSDRRRSSSRSPEQLQELRDETMALIDRIRSTTEFPAKPSALCRWCEYQQLCPAQRSQAPEAPEPPAPDELSEQLALL